MAVSEEWKLTSLPRNRFHLSLSRLTTVSLTMMPGTTLLHGAGQVSPDNEHPSQPVCLSAIPASAFASS